MVNYLLVIVFLQLEVSLATLTKFVVDFKTALDKAISKNISDKEKAEKTEKPKKDVKDVLGKTLKHVCIFDKVLIF